MKYNAKYIDICHITDALGLPIDNKIKHTVIALQLNGFNTNASCQGHYNWGGGGGLPYPWIDLDKNNDLTKINFLINSFNKHRKISYNLYLKTINIGIFGDFRIMHYNSITDNGFKNKQLLIELQNDINNFGNFLLIQII